MLIAKPVSAELTTKEKETLGDLYHQKAKLQETFSSEDERLRTEAAATLKVIQDQIDVVNKLIEAAL